MAANPLEFLGDVANKGVAGYMSGKIREKEAKLDDIEMQNAAAAMQREDDIRVGGQEFEMDKQGDQQTFLGNQQEARLTQARDLAEKRLAAEAVRETARQGRYDSTRTDTQGKRKRVAFHNPEYGKTGESETLNFFDAARVDEQGAPIFENAGGNRVDVTGLKPYSPPATGSVMRAAKVERERTKESDTRMLEADTVLSVITDPELEDATGMPFAPDRWMAYFGIDEKAQYTQEKMASVSLTAASPALEKLGVNPTDVDLVKAFETVPGPGTQPYGWVRWAEDTYLPALSRAIKRGSNPELHDDYMAAARRQVERAYEVQGMKKPSTDLPSGWSEG